MNENLESNFLSAVAYLHNAEGQVEPFLKMLTGEISAHFKQYEIILVNDASKDGSAAAVKNFVKNSGGKAPITLVNMSIFQGVELAMNAGLDLSIGDFILEFDTLEIGYDASLLHRAYQTALGGFDIVSVSPPKNRSGGSSLFYRLYNRYSHSKYDIQTDVFRVISRRALNRVHAISPTLAYRKAAYASSGLKIETMRDAGVTMLTDSNHPLRFSTALNSLALYTDAAQGLSFGIACLMLAATVFELVYTLCIYLGGSHPVDGWTTTMLVLTFGFFGVFMILAIILKYLSLLVDLIFKHQKYLVESIEKLQP